MIKVRFFVKMTFMWVEFPMSAYEQKHHSVWYVIWLKSEKYLKNLSNKTCAKLCFNCERTLGIFVLLCVSATSLADTNSHARRISQRSFSNPCHLTLLSSKVILHKSCGELRGFQSELSPVQHGFFRRKQHGFHNLTRLL